MKKQFIERGRYKGNYDVPATIRTMEVGEKWIIDESFANMGTVRNCCSLANKNTDMRFEAHCPSYSEPYISIVRTK